MIRSLLLLILLPLGLFADWPDGARVAVPRMLDELITWVKGHEGVWFATCTDTAAYVTENARRQPGGIHVQ